MLDEQFLCLDTPNNPRCWDHVDIPEMRGFTILQGFPKSLPIQLDPTVTLAVRG